MEDAVRHRTLSTTDRSRGRDDEEGSDCDHAFVVDVLYGPTRICGVVKHRVGWVESVKDALERLRFRVNLRRISDPETVAFAFEGRVVFACAARYLSFRGCASFDPTADAAVRTLVAERDAELRRRRRQRARTAAAVVSRTPPSTSGSDRETRPDGSDGRDACDDRTRFFID